MAGKELSINEIKEIELNILQDVHNFCEQKGILYILIGGTLLGAIRHKGFIPWDDDIDIAMPRPDYNRFIKEYKSPNYEIKTIDNCSDYVFTFGKVVDNSTILIENKSNKSNLGVNIDIFPIDGLPSNIKKAEKYADNAMLLTKIIILKQMKYKKSRGIKKNVFFIIGKILLLPFSYRRLTKIAINHSLKYRFENSSIVANLSWGFGRKEILNKDRILKRKQITFENQEFYISENYEDYLKNRFGDYMQFPPEEERISHHQFRVYYK